ncbi:MAG: hypothetical protein QOE90_2077 [Thermoplasmata archaeon]|jgi:hypothetical protein|nr:hypothetical protein [Thermoplasmata archaeon]
MANTREGSDACTPVSATALGHADVPFFPTPLALALGIVGAAAVAALVLARR